jgi:TRAP-type uncharacterized transport system fused permease subunit
LLVADGFTWAAFAITLIGAMVGIAFIGVAFSGYMLAPLSTLQRWWVGLAALLFIAPGLATMALGLALISPVFVLQLFRRQSR